MSVDAVNNHETVPAGPEVRSRISWKLPAIHFAVAVLLLGLWLTASGKTAFTLSRDRKKDVPGEAPAAFIVDAKLMCLVLFLACFAVFVYVLSRTILRAKVGVVPTVVAAVSAVLGILTWYGGGVDGYVTLTFILASGLALATPLIFGSLAGIVSERVGIVNIAIEGQLLVGAFVGVVVASWWQNVWYGLVAAPVAGALLGAILAFFAIRYNVDQIIVGVVLNVLAAGLTTFFFSTQLKDNPDNLNSPGFGLENIAIPGLSKIPVLGPVFFNQTALTYFMYVFVAALTVGLYRSRWGLRLRACGEHPDAAATVGIHVRATRFRNSLFAGAIAGLGGAYFTIAANTGHSFNDNISAGNGYIALAAMILGKWNPLGAVAAALMFGLAQAIAILLSTLDDGAPKNIINMIPYIITIFAVAGFVGRSRPPAAENQPY